jgi:protein-tyrosine phosphatase
MVSILFVCLGNICRSPAAEGILRHQSTNHPVLKKIHIESCGLGSWHQGQLPDLRMQDAAKRRGIILSSRAQKIQDHFFDKFDYILAADHEVLKVLYQYAKSPEQKAKLHLISAFSDSYRNEEIPDPFYGNEASFEHVLDMLEDSCEGLIEHIKTKETNFRS